MKTVCVLLTKQQKHSVAITLGHFMEIYVPRVTNNQVKHSWDLFRTG